MTATELWERLLDDLVALLPRALRPRNPRMGYWAARIDACVRASAAHTPPRDHREGHS